MLPDILLGSLAEQRAHVAGAIDSIIQKPIAQLGAGLAHRQEFRCTMRIRQATLLDRTLRTVGRGGRAEERTKLHDGRVVKSWMLAIEQFLAQLAEMLLTQGGIKRNLVIVQTRQHAIDIAVHGDIWQVVGKRRDGASGIVANAWQRTPESKHIVDIAERSGRLLQPLSNELGRTVHVAGTRIVTQSLPIKQDFVFGGLRQRLHRRETLQKA